MSCPPLAQILNILQRMGRSPSVLIIDILQCMGRSPLLHVSENQPLENTP